MKLTLENISKIISLSLKNQKKKLSSKGFSLYELEADVTIPSEYILMMHFLGKIDLDIQSKIKKYILRTQNKEGGWPLYYDGKSNISASVKAYYALKLAGENINSVSMKKAKKNILRIGGAEKSNVFTKIMLALFEQISWESVPVMPIEIINLPKWFSFHLNKISYWSRTVLVPLLIILNKKPVANNPNGLNINELFLKKKFKIDLPKNDKKLWSGFFKIIDRLLRKIDPYISRKYKQKCTEKAYNWILERLNGKDGLGGIFPAMVNSLIAFSIDDYGRFEKEIKIVRKSIDNLLIIKDKEAYCQPCLSPVWDTGWVGLSMIENNQNIDHVIKWLLDNEIKVKGDWSNARPNLKPGGWAFQFKNDFYPDVDDSALIGMLLDRYEKKNPSKKLNDSIQRTRKWIIGMQSKNGGWGAFDVDNNYSYLNFIPFADHGALLDPPTVDVSARCISFLAQLNIKEDKEIIEKGIKYIIKEQENDGSWFGRWGTNYIYGTWSVISALNLILFKEKEAVINKAISFLKKSQRTDGGWGEDGSSYDRNLKYLVKKSTPSQTSWAVLGLIAAGEIKSNEVSKGIQYLLKSSKNGKWIEDYYTAVGFPKVFYLKYHGYAEYFPILALSRYKNLINKNYLKSNAGV